MPNVPFAGAWRGHAGVREFFRIVAEVQETVEFTPKSFIAQGDAVVALGTFVNRVMATGKTARSNWAQVWTSRAGKLASMHEYVDTLAVNSAYTP